MGEGGKKDKKQIHFHIFVISPGSSYLSKVLVWQICVQPSLYFMAAQPENNKQ